MKDKLNESEEKVYDWLIEDVGLSPSNIKRPNQGIDFVYNGKYGIEVKTDMNYRLSRNQLHHIHDLENTYVVAVNTGNAYNGEALEVVDSIGSISFGDPDTFLDVAAEIDEMEQQWINDLRDNGGGHDAFSYLRDKLGVLFCTMDHDCRGEDGDLREGYFELGD